jgi:hypothetical protein
MSVFISNESKLMHLHSVCVWLCASMCVSVCVCFVCVCLCVFVCVCVCVFVRVLCVCVCVCVRERDDLRCILHKSLPSVCVSVCVSLFSLLSKFQWRRSCGNEVSFPIGLRRVKKEVDDYFAKIFLFVFINFIIMRETGPPECSG